MILECLENSSVAAFVGAFSAFVLMALNDLRRRSDYVPTSRRPVASYPGADATVGDRTPVAALRRSVVP